MKCAYHAINSVERLVRAGELEIFGGDQAEIDTYFDTAQFRFHGPDGFETDYAGLTNYFQSIRGAFDDRSIRRGIIVAESDYVACQTWIEGRFVYEFTHSRWDVSLPTANGWSGTC